MLSGLKEKRADYNDDGSITGSEIGMYVQEKVSLDTDNFQTPQMRRFTTQEGEIIFITQVEQKEEQEKELDYQQILQAMVLQMSQQPQNQNNQIQVNDKPLEMSCQSVYVPFGTEKNFNNYIYPFICMIVLVSAEISVRYSGTSWNHTFIYYLIPVGMVPLFYFVLIRKFKYENLH